MKRLFFTFIISLLVISFIGCNSSNDDTSETESFTDITLLQFPHLDGHGSEITKDMPILFEYEMRDYVKYQVAFVACTCRAPRDNFWSVAYYDIDKTTGEVLYLSFDEDSSGHYQAGVWGDSSPIPVTGLTYEDNFKVDFIPWLVGQNADDLEGINIFYDDTPSVYADYANTKEINEPEMIDTYAGSSVSTNNLIRVTKTLLDYHQEKYVD
ncbi:MAG: hypothetical protein ACLFPM_04185 [Candidatus Izemoplasmatales bacterium]